MNLFAQTDTHNERPIYRLQLRYAVSLLTIAALIISSQVFFLDPVLHRIASHTRMINVAVQQRARAEKINTLALSLLVTTNFEDYRAKQDLLRQTLAHFRAAHDGLQNGSSALNIPGSQNAQMRALLAFVTHEYNEIVRGSECLTGDVPCSGSLSDHVRRITDHEADYLSYIDAVASQLEIEAQQHIAQAQNTGLLWRALVLSLLFVEGFFVFRPGFAKIQDSFRRLRASENLSRQIIHNLPDSAVLLFDHDLRFLLANGPALAAAGFYNLEGKTLFETVPPEAAARLAPLYRRALQGEHVIEESEAVGRAYINQFVPVRSETGAIIGGLVLIQEITARKRAEDALKTDRAMLRTLIDNIPDYMFVKDREGRFILSNHAHALAAGTSDPSTIIGKTAHDVFPNEMSSRFVDDDQIVLNTGLPLVNEERETIDPAGRSKWVLTTKIPLRDENEQIIGLVGISRDITERRQALQALEEREILFRAMSESSPFGIFVTDGNGDDLYINPAYERITGMTAAEAYGGRWSNGVHPEDRERVVRDWQACLAKQIVYDADYRYQHKDGRVVSAHIKAAPLFDSAGKMRGYVGMLEDITERKQSEQRVLELAVEREKVKMLERIVSGVSHDLRTPLTIISSSLYLLEKTQDADRRTYHIGIMGSAVTRITTLLEEMLTMSWLDRDGLTLDADLCDLNALAASIVEDKKMLAQEHGQFVEFIPAQPPPLIPASSQDLRRAIEEILLNAFTFTPHTGTITLRTTAHTDSVHLSIQDTGQGIAAEELPLIFERFYRGDQARGSQTGKTGLGLTIAQRIVEAHQGRIEVESRVGQGSTFTIILPANPTPPPH